MGIRIEHDVYDIAKRVKDIDIGYYVVYNTSRQKFEIHNSNQMGSSFCLTVPYDQLDERALKLVRKTQSANIDEILEQIENDNKNLESAENSSVFSSVIDTFEQNLKFNNN